MLKSRKERDLGDVGFHPFPWLVLTLPDAAAGPGGDSRLAEFERVLPPYFILPLTDSR